MRRKLVKMALGVAILSGSLGVGLPAKEARATLACAPICCDPRCISVRPCHGIAGNCICSQFCQIGPQG